jgi:hypothetical protein
MAEVTQKRNNHRVTVVSAPEVSQFSINGVCVQQRLGRMFSGPVTCTCRSGSASCRK